MGPRTRSASPDPHAPRARLGMVLLLAVLCGVTEPVAAQVSDTGAVAAELARLREIQAVQQRLLVSLMGELSASRPASRRTQAELDALAVLHELDTRRADHASPAPEKESGFLSSGLFGGKFRLDLSGYLKFDANWADQQLQDGDLLFLARGRQTPLDNPQFTVSGRESRFALTIQGPPALGAQTGGKFELDFFGGVGGLNQGANSAQPEPALRSAFFSLIWARPDGRRATELLIGQDFVPFGNWFPHLTTFAKGVDVGTYFLLAPQARLIQRWRSQASGGQELRLSAAVARSISGVFGIAGDLNTGNNFVGIAEQRGLPEFHASVLYANDALGRAPFWGVPTPLTLSVSGVYGEERLVDFGGQPGNTRDFRKWGIDAKLFVPIVGSRDGRPGGTLSLKAYATFQQNLDEGLGNGLTGIVLRRGGNPAEIGDLGSVRGRAGWAELTYYPTQTTYLHAMVGRLRNDRFDGVVEGFAFPTAAGFSGVRENTRYTVSLKQQVQNILVGLDYSQILTEFMNGQTGRINNVLLGTYFFF